MKNPRALPRLLALLIAVAGFMAAASTAAAESRYAVAEDGDAQILCYPGGDQECPDGGIIVDS